MFLLESCSRWFSTGDRPHELIRAGVAAVAGCCVGVLVSWMRWGPSSSALGELLAGRNEKLPTASLQHVRGKALLRKAFALDDAPAFLNHGSYGAVPLPVMSEQRALVGEMERNPDHWFRWSGGREGTGGVDPRWIQAADLVAGFIGAEPGEVAFVKNATAGVNAILRSLQLKHGEAILVTTQTYGAVANAAKDVCARAGGEVVVLDIKLRHLAEPEQICRILSDVLLDKPNIRLALLDHITSPTAVVMPIKRLVEICHGSRVQVLVDGAHAPGTIVPLDVKAIGADYYTGNLHKWMFCPKGTGFVWAPRDAQKDVHPVVVSHYYKQSFHERFFMQGTLDDTSFLTVPRAFQFVEELGGAKAVAAYNKNLLSWAAGMLVQEWGTDLLAPLEYGATTMACIRLPLDACFDAAELRANGERIGGDLFRELWFDYGIVCPIIITTDAGLFLEHLYARISVQVYNEKDDYVRLAKAIVSLRDGRLARLRQV